MSNLRHWWRHTYWLHTAAIGLLVLTMYWLSALTAILLFDWLIP